MVIRLLREKPLVEATFGFLFINGVFQCYTIENSKLLIPLGKYDLEYFDSVKNKLTVPLLKNVPNRTMIEIHPANYPHELLGCIAPGEVRDVKNQRVLFSKQQFFRLMTILRLENNNSISIEAA